MKIKKSKTQKKNLRTQKSKKSRRLGNLKNPRCPKNLRNLGNLWNIGSLRSLWNPWNLWNLWNLWILRNIIVFGKQFLKQLKTTFFLFTLPTVPLIFNSELCQILLQASSKENIKLNLKIWKQIGKIKLV